MPTTTLNSPLNVSGGGGSGDSILGDIGEVTNQIKGQTAEFGKILTDPQQTGQSEMAAMLKLQRAISLETMMYQTCSNIEKARTDATKNTIQNMR